MRKRGWVVYNFPLPPKEKSFPAFFLCKCPFELIFVAFCRSQHKDFAREETNQKEANTYIVKKNCHFVTFSPFNFIHCLRRKSKLNTVFLDHLLGMT